MTNEFFIGILGLVLSVLTYFAGVQRTKQRYEQDDSEKRINKVVDEYQKIFQPRKASGLPVLIESGVLLLKNDSEIREASRRLELRNNESPFLPHKNDLLTVDLLKFFQAIQNHKLNPRHPDCVRVAKEKME